MTIQAWRRLALYLGLMLGLDALLLASDPGITASAGLVLELLPGLTFAEWAFRGRMGRRYFGGGQLDSGGRALLGLGSGCAILVLVMLVVHYVPGPVSPWLLLFLINGLGLLFLLLRLRAIDGEAYPASSTERHSVGVRGILRTGVVGLICVLVLAAAFRLPRLHYSEFQGDEAIVMLKAAAVIQGREDVLFRHKKGPAEILIPTALLALGGRLPEAWARLPFALAGLGGLGLVYLLGREMTSQKAGLWAALFSALNGYLVAFSRIVQYQSLVFLLSALALWCGYRFARARAQAGGYLVLAGLFTGVGLLAHYDAVFILPPLGYLVWHRWRRSGQVRGAVLRAVLLSLAVLVVILLSFYLPFVLHPHFEAARSYIAARTGGRPPYLNLRHFWVNSTIYNSVYYVLLMALLLLLAAAWHFKHLLTRSRDLLAGATWVWFAGPFVLYTFVLRDPRTHLYIMFPAMALLAGRALTLGLERLESDSGRVLVYGVCAGVCLLSAGYLYLAFVQTDPLYRRTYPEHRSALYPTPYGDSFPEVGVFGFPYRAGWKVIGALYQTEVLQGDYDSNEEEPITRWYTGGAVRCPHWPRYYFIAWNVQDEFPVPEHVLSERYGVQALVKVDEQIRLRIFERDVPPAAEPTVYRLADYTDSFDLQATVEGLETGYPVNGSERAITDRRPFTFEGGSIHLVGYSLGDGPVLPGGALRVSLYWQASGIVPEDYTVFVHLEDEGRVWAQKDGPPHCAERPTSSWEPGMLIVDEHILVLDAATPPGSYPLRVGLYIPQTGRRLHAFDPGGEDLGGAVELVRVAID